MFNRVSLFLFHMRMLCCTQVLDDKINNKQTNTPFEIKQVKFTTSV